MNWISRLFKKPKSIPEKIENFVTGPTDSPQKSAEYHAKEGWAVVSICHAGVNFRGEHTFMVAFTRKR